MAISAILAGVGVGCSDNDADFVIQEQPESGYITVTLNCMDAVTREPGDEPYIEDGVKDLNENLISSVTLCLWAKGGDKPDATAKPDFVQRFTNLDAQRTVKLRVPITPALKNTLFGTDAGECNAFAAVNITPPSGEFTIAELRNLTISSTFDTQRIQSQFAMDGDCTVKYTPTDNRAIGSIDLQRSAAKITLALNVDELVEQTVVLEGKVYDATWRPNYDGMRVYLTGGLKTSTLDPNLEERPAEDDFFNTSAEREYIFINNDKGEDGNPDNGNNPGDKDYPFIQQYPFYTYPHRWSSEPGDYATSYLQLSIPWRRVDKDGNFLPDSSWRTCYYQVPIIAADSDVLELVRNVSYHIYLHVGLLGSFIPDEPLELENLEYSAAEWGTADMDVSIPDVRYLVVDQNDYTVNNETSITIPFYTSHETVVTDATMTFYRYNYTDVGLERAVTVNMTQNVRSFQETGDSVFYTKFDNNTKSLIVRHNLKIYEPYNNIGVKISLTQDDGPSKGLRRPTASTDRDWNNLVSSNNIRYFREIDDDEYSRVEFTITLQHQDIYDLDHSSPNFKEVIHIIQYPGIYIETTTNRYNTNPDTGNIEGTGLFGNTCINGNYDDPDCDRYAPSGGESNGWMTSIGLYSREPYNNFNPNLYLVTVTTLPQDTKYRIGNPRSNYINNFLGSSITNNENAPLPTGENTRTWTGQTYTYTAVPDDRNQTRVTVVGFSEQPAIYEPGSNGRRSLKYYYPTLEDDEHKMMIAPKFRICSSYAGTTWILNRELSRRRAAAYQELGYPAGRWRLPTFGEVSFLMELCAQFRIPRLFGHPTGYWYYWCAQGLVCVPPKNSPNPSPTLPGDRGYVAPTSVNPNVQRARFVYDEWYWGNNNLTPVNGVYSFTWGDRPYNN
ncbi:MAG: hypothetical protein K2H60_01045 [Muribaculaceae bacterium]|nr:hypothetical protein [Muribaculaceae bacterium]